MYERAFIDSESRGAGAPLRFVLSTPGIKRDGLSLDMRDVERKYRMGYLNAVSISWQYRDEGQMEWYDLLEASAVAVPADPDALMDGRSVVLTSKEYEKLVEGTERLSSRIESLEREVQAERARAAAIHALRSL